MSIIPAGKRRDQVAQGGLKNDTILNSEFFQKFGQGTSSLLDDKPETAQPNQASDVERAMGGSQSQLNMDGDIPGADAGQQSQQPQDPQQLQHQIPEGQVQVPQGAKFDPNTGLPVASLSGMEAWQQARNAFAEKIGELSIEIRGDPNDVNWQVIISPKGGKAVSKGR
jgi:hypothetical protein